MSSLKRKEGYLLIDHRFSPGVPDEIARKTGFDPKFMGEGKVMEVATLTCAHCKTAVVKNPLRIRERAYCSKCDNYICDGCGAERDLPNYIHTSYEKFSDLMLEQDQKGMTLGSPFELLNNPKIFVP